MSSDALKNTTIMEELNLEDRWRAFIVARREQLGLNQEKAALMIYGDVPYPKQKINSLEKGSKSPTLKTMSKVLSAYGCNLNFIVNE